MQFASLNGAQAYLSNRLDQILLNKSILHTLMVEHSCGINENLLFLKALQHTEYQNTNFRVVVLSGNYLPIALGLNISFSMLLNN